MVLKAHFDWLVQLIRISFAIYLRATREKIASKFATVTSQETIQIIDEALPANTKKATFTLLEQLVAFLLEISRSFLGGLLSFSKSNI